MAWYVWVIIIDLGISALWKVGKVGEYREPISGFSHGSLHLGHRLGGHVISERG